MEYAEEIMVDLETLSTAPNARIIQIGAVKFNRLAGTRKKVEIISKFKVNVSCTSGDVSPSTLKWWKEQIEKSPNLEKSLEDPEPIDIQQGLTMYRKFCKGAEYQWSNGSSFDCVILDWHYRDLGMKNPFRFYKYRDTRTVYEILDPNNDYKDRCHSVVKGSAHDAVVDCLRQTYRLQCCFREFQRRNMLALKDSF